MSGKLGVAIAVMAAMLFLAAGCTEVIPVRGPPSIPHRSEGLEAVDCLACHELGMKGATKIPENHLDSQGGVRYDGCDCHEPAPLEQQTPWGQTSQMREFAEIARLVLTPIGLTVVCVALASRGRGRH